jgi:putative sterol carrier protein
MRVADEHCEVRPGTIEAPDLAVTMPAMLFLAVHRGEASPVLGVLTGRIRLKGQRRLFPLLARLFPTETGGSILHRLAFHARQWLRRRRAQGGKA